MIPTNQFHDEEELIALAQLSGQLIALLEAKGIERSLTRRLKVLKVEAEQIHKDMIQRGLDEAVQAGMMERTKDGHYRMTAAGQAYAQQLIQANAAAQQTVGLLADNLGVTN